MGKLFAASVKMLYRDKQALFWAMAFPVIFAVVFGLFDFSQAPEVSIGVVAESESRRSSGPSWPASKEVDSFTVEDRSDLEPPARSVVDGDLDVVLAVPPPATNQGGLARRAARSTCSTTRATSSRTSSRCPRSSGSWMG